MTKKQNCLYQWIRNFLREHGVDEKLSHTMATIHRVEPIERRLRQIYPKGMLIAMHSISSTPPVVRLDGELYEYVIQRLLKWVLCEYIWEIRKGLSFSHYGSFAFDQPTWVAIEIIPNYIKDYQN